MQGKDDSDIIPYSGKCMPPSSAAWTEKYAHQSAVIARTGTLSRASVAQEPL